MPKIKKKKQIGYKIKGLRRRFNPQGQLQEPTTSKENQESDYFWTVPSLELSSSDEIPCCNEAEIFEHKEDSDGAKAHQFYLILHCIYEYEPSRNVDAIAEALKPDFLERLNTKLKTCELPSMWTLARCEEYISIVEISLSLPSVIQKNLVIYPDRNMHVYVHNKKLVADERKQCLISDCKLQISQSIKFSVCQILSIIRKLSSASVCCGNFEQNCLDIYEHGIIQNVCKKSYMEGDFHQVTCDGIAYSKTIRSNNCSLILEKKNLRCNECSKIRKFMRLSEYKKKLPVLPEEIEGSSSTVPFSYLTSDQKTRRLQNLSKALRSEQQLTAKLKQILAKHVEISANT